MVARRSGVNRDPRGIGAFGLVSMLASSSGLIPSGRAVLTGRIFLSLRLYNVRIAAVYFFNSRLRCNLRLLSYVRLLDQGHGQIIVVEVLVAFSHRG